MGYPGGKGGAGIYHRLISLMPPHEVYIEPFLGSGVLMRMKRPARLNIGVDLDAAPLAAYDDGDVPELELHQADGIAFLERYPFAGRELVYADPPYLLSTRSSGRPIYRYEMTDDQHRRLLAVLNRLPCPVLLSGYWSQVYAEALRPPAWRSLTYTAMTRGGRPAKETVWFNFEPPSALHDYRYLGQNFRERERIRRKQNRWRLRLERMPVLERQALLAAIASLDTSGDGGSARGFSHRPNLAHGGRD